MICMLFVITTAMTSKAAITLLLVEIPPMGNGMHLMTFIRDQLQSRKMRWYQKMLIFYSIKSVQVSRQTRVLLTPGHQFHQES